MPVSVPAGFKPIFAADMGIAIAVPNDWERQSTPSLIALSPSQQQPNSTNAMYVGVQIEPCTQLLLLSESDLEKVQKSLTQMMGMIHFRGASVSESYLGHKASVTPLSLTFPGDALEPPQATDLTFNMLMREIYDEHNGRCIKAFYPDSEMGKQVGSTLNITSPSF
jgi:hypothetical protein